MKENCIDVSSIQLLLHKEGNVRVIAQPTQIQNAL